MTDTLSYETAKRLKEAGFPKETFQLLDGKTGVDDPKHYTAIGEPTLSELIEQCGDSFAALLNVSGSKVGFVACEPGDFSNGPFILLDLTRAKKTPSEAVAALYLALNEKK